MGAGIIDDRMVGGWEQERRIEPGLAVGRWEPGKGMGARIGWDQGCGWEQRGLMGAKGWSKVGSQECV